MRHRPMLAGVARGSIIRAENGGIVSCPNIRRFAEVLGITVGQLMHDDPTQGKIAGAA